MTHNKLLFGQPIVSGLRVSRTEQVRDVLCQEIQTGRWQIGDRMPSVTDLVGMTGLSRGSIQKALALLGAQGYIQQIKRKGTFLASVAPTKGAPGGLIGVAMMKEDADSPGAANPPFLLQLHWILDIATRRGFLTKVWRLGPYDDWTRLDRVDGPFGDEVLGVITPYPFKREDTDLSSPDRLPLVFVGAHRIDSLPYVCGDTWHGTYRLTQRVIAAGHRRVIACRRPGETEIESRLFLDAYRQAMMEANLPIDESAIDRSHCVANGEQSGLRDYLREFSEATAIIVSSTTRARELVALYDEMGARVPEDISIVTRDSGPMRLDDNSRAFTCFEYRTRAAVRTAFDLLIEMIEKRRTPYTRLMIAPLPIEGDSLAAPRKPKRLPLKGARR